MHYLQNALRNLARVGIRIRLGLGFGPGLGKKNWKLCIHDFRMVQCILQIAQIDKSYKQYQRNTTVCKKFMYVIKVIETHNMIFCWSSHVSVVLQ